MFKERQHEIDIILGQHTEADEKFTFTVTYLLSLASKAPELFKVSKVEQKQQLIKFVLSNMTLKGKELQYQVKKPFDALIECAKSQEWLPLVDTLRTSFLFWGNNLFNQIKYETHLLV